MSDADFTKVFAAMIAGMVALTILLIILAYAVGGEAGSEKSQTQIWAKDEETTARVAPVASMAIGEVAAQADTTASSKALSGESVYQTSCLACHGAGVAGAPKYGDAAAWEPRLAQGIDVLYEHALGGLNAMPAKGGNAGLSDGSVKAAVDYMIGRETADQDSEPQDDQADTGVATTEAATAGADATTEPASAAAGESIYQASCSVCHTAGVAAAPRIGQAVDWETRIAQGTEVLYEHAIGGLNVMPPKGGNPALSDGDVKAAVDYMLSTVN